MGRSCLDALGRIGCLNYLHTKQAPPSGSGVSLNGWHPPRSDSRNRLKLTSQLARAGLSLFHRRVLSATSVTPAPGCTPLYYTVNWTPEAQLAWSVAQIIRPCYQSCKHCIGRGTQKRTHSSRQTTVHRFFEIRKKAYKCPEDEELYFIEKLTLFIAFFLTSRSDCRKKEALLHEKNI